MTYNFNDLIIKINEAMCYTKYIFLKHTWSTLRYYCMGDILTYCFLIQQRSNIRTMNMCIMIKKKYKIGSLEQMRIRECLLI